MVPERHDGGQSGGIAACDADGSHFSGVGRVKPRYIEDNGECDGNYGSPWHCLGD